MSPLKSKWKRRLFAWLSLAAAMVMLVEFNKYMKRQATPCEDGVCPLPTGHGLYIDPFPDEIIPKDVTTNQPNEGIEHE
ncbi:hypothetical protein [Tichowtungia aerotolerans]|uniref:Uncharacterized protein n=1 Tax=Tichowtungia aerotolerans TaxID=2697043 RepID=A0A6P1M581_9BACT|nr:hypothetical protein [Tichowtungia aerotolerans]QHI69740.1 hypothetical protein GT409_09845 [Tichowtungia aerotolerans]